MKINRSSLMITVFLGCIGVCAPKMSSGTALVVIRGPKEIIVTGDSRAFFGGGKPYQDNACKIRATKNQVIVALEGLSNPTGVKGVNLLTTAHDIAEAQDFHTQADRIDVGKKWLGVVKAEYLRWQALNPELFAKISGPNPPRIFTEAIFISFDRDGMPRQTIAKVEINFQHHAVDETLSDNTQTVRALSDGVAPFALAADAYKRLKGR